MNNCLRLRLIDLKQSIDTRQFPDDQMFVGSPPSLSSSVINVDGKPWKWQVDYYGLALCILSLITQPNHAMVVKTELSPPYRWSDVCKPYK